MDAYFIYIILIIVLYDGIFKMFLKLYHQLLIVNYTVYQF